jgi:hypothetical protein
VEFNTPKATTTIRDLYNFVVNVSVFDPDLDVKDVNLSIYQEGGMTYLNQTGMVQASSTSYSANYLYQIDPINLENGMWIFEVNVSDSIGWRNYSIEVLINNDAPKVEFITPALTELYRQPFTKTLGIEITNEEPINSAKWTISKELGEEEYLWDNLTYNPDTELWEGLFNLLDYEYGDYYLIVNATDDKYNSSLTHRLYEFHPRLLYEINESEIVYDRENIFIGFQEDTTTQITGEFYITHNDSIKEQNFTTRIPESYGDAKDYRLIRTLRTYKPLGEDSGTYVNWSVKGYQNEDYITFHLEKPYIENGELETDGKYIQPFIIHSKHSLNQFQFKNVLNHIFKNPEEYEAILEYYENGSWKEVENYESGVLGLGDYEGGKIVVLGNWEGIEGGKEIKFRIIVQRIDNFVYKIV